MAECDADWEFGIRTAQGESLQGQKKVTKAVFKSRKIMLQNPLKFVFIMDWNTATGIF